MTAQTAVLEWTRELPTKHGWYWFKGPLSLNPRIVQVVGRLERPRVIIDDSSSRYVDEFPPASIWFGPLVPPAAPYR